MTMPVRQSPLSWASNLRSVSLLTLAALVASFVGCSSLSKPTVLQAVSVSIGKTPAALSTNGVTKLSATITNDSANAGVTWSLTCASAGPNAAPGVCGTLSNMAATSVTYTAPLVVPLDRTVTVTATSKTDTTRMASATFTIDLISVKITTPPSSLLTNQSIPLSATITNDLNNAGVTWTVTCKDTAPGACGTLSNVTLTTATYTAPPAIPLDKDVFIHAISVADPTKKDESLIAIGAITVSFPTPVAFLQTNSSTTVTATVSFDPNSAGATFSVTCGSAGACGAFSNISSSTTNGVTTTTATYTAPAAVPTGNTVTITATSVTDATKSASGTITITPPPLADGTYVFSVAGENSSNNSPYFLSGVFVVSNSVITKGEQDYVDLSVSYQNDQLAKGTIAITADGNLQIVLTTCTGTDCTTPDSNVGEGGVETFNATATSSTSWKLIEFDTSLSSSGNLNLQDSQAATATPSAGYAFYAAGLDGGESLNGIFPVAVGGVINIDNAGGTGGISGTGSVFDFNDASFDNGLGVFQDQLFTQSSVSAPDQFGRVLFTLNPDPSSGINGLSFNFAGYIVDASHVRLVETSGDTFAGFMGGVALGQGANTGTFSDASVDGNSYVAGLSGADSSPLFQVLGLFTMTSGNVGSGFMNYNDLTGIGPLAPSPISGGAYTVDPTGRVTITGVTDGFETFNLQFYLTASGQESEFTAASMDQSDVLAGIGFQQTGGGSFSSTSFSGNYVFNATGNDSSGAGASSEIDAVGTIITKTNGFATDGKNPAFDLNSLTQGEFSGIPLFGTFTIDPSGAFSGSITCLDVNGTFGAGCTSNSGASAFTYYMVDPTNIFTIETDTNELILGTFTLQQ